MKACWDNIEKYQIKISSKGFFRSFYKEITLYINICQKCGDEYFSRRKEDSFFCSRSCANSFISKTRKISQETRDKLRNANLGDKNPFWRGGYRTKNIAVFDIHKKYIEKIKEIKRNDFDFNILEIKCDYCDKFFIPTINQIKNIYDVFRGVRNGHGKVYCSKECKTACPIFNKKKWPKAYKIGSSREVSSELRKIVLTRDNWTCQICGTVNKELHCHHIDPVKNNPIESSDIDNCITLCKKCHISVHSNNKNCSFGYLASCPGA